MFYSRSFSRNPWLLRALAPAGFSLLLFACVSHSAVSVPGDLEPSCEARVRLAWMDPNQLFPWNQKRVAEEVETVLADVGIEVYWTVVPDPEGRSSPSVHETAIKVLLTPMDSSMWGLQDNVMGAVIEPGENPMVFIFFPNLKRALGYSKEEKVNRSPQDIYRFAIALGRVIAHEVVHVCFPEMPHTHVGLMSGRWNLKNLEYERPVKK